ncbi:MAG: alcohol dehydrogenase catalytic domain-containing protein [bacterium]|nr:alcohol dehydrogenase catalytic domain-containing protein [bacterium]
MPPPSTFAMVLTAPRQLEARDLPIPDLTDDTALLRLEACGICGSDYEQFEGALRTPTPVIPGHEPLGVIEAIGDRAAEQWRVDVGDRVAVENMISCGHCTRCLAGLRHLCERRKIYSYIPLAEQHGLWGAYAHHMVLAPGSVVHKIDAALPPELAVLFNPLGAGFRWAVEIPQTKPGDDVLVMGPGQRGLASVLAARQAGANKIIVTGLSADAKKLELARAFGADATIDVEHEDVRERVRELTDGRGVDVVVEVTSYATTPVTEALDLVRMGGTVVLAGVKGFKAIPDFISDKIVIKEIRVHGAIGVTSSAYRSGIRMIEGGQHSLERMHTHEFSLEDAELAIRTLAREIPGEDAIHCSLHPQP